MATLAMSHGHHRREVYTKDNRCIGGCTHEHISEAQHTSHTAHPKSHLQRGRTKKLAKTSLEGGKPEFGLLIFFSKTNVDLPICW